MAIPGYAVVTGAFGTSDCSMRAAADSWPHPGLVELPNIVDATPRGRGLGSATSGAQWTSSFRRLLGRRTNSVDRQTPS
jgi:hypothetical protein